MGREVKENACLFTKIEACFGDCSVYFWTIKIESRLRPLICFLLHYLVKWNCLICFCFKKMLTEQHCIIKILDMYISPVWKIQKMVKNPCLSVKNMRIWCEKFQKKFGLNWRFPWGAIAKTCSLAFCSAICPLHVIYKAICGPKKIHPVCLTFEPLRLQMTTIA